ncbi:unnamed protein product, partial [Darwinula stevensoni]
MTVPEGQGYFLIQIQALICSQATTPSTCRSCIRGAGYMNLLLSPVSTMQSFMTTVKSCITNDTNLKTKYGTCSTNLDCPMVKERKKKYRIKAVAVGFFKHYTREQMAPLNDVAGRKGRDCSVHDVFGEVCHYMEHLDQLGDSDTDLLVNDDMFKSSKHQVKTKTRRPEIKPAHEPSYGQMKPCFIYRLVTDNCLERKMYDRQVSKQGVADRVVDELNPDNVLWTRDSTNLLSLDDTEPPEKDFAPQADDFADQVLKCVLKTHGAHLTKEPFAHESLLIDRKDKKLSEAEKRLAKRSYELEKQQATMRAPYGSYSYGNAPYMPRIAGGNVFMNPRGFQPSFMNRGPFPYGKQVGNALPMQTELLNKVTSSPLLARQGLTMQQLTIPKDVMIPTTTGDGAPIRLRAGQAVTVIRSMKGIFLRLQDGKLVAIKLPPGAQTPGLNRVSTASNGPAEVINLDDSDEDGEKAKMTPLEPTVSESGSNLTLTGLLESQKQTISGPSAESSHSSSSNGMPTNAMEYLHDALSKPASAFRKPDQEADLSQELQDLLKTPPNSVTYQRPAGQGTLTITPVTTSDAFKGRNTSVSLGPRAQMANSATVRRGVQWQGASSNRGPYIGRALPSQRPMVRTAQVQALRPSLPTSVRMGVPITRGRPPTPSRGPSPLPSRLPFASGIPKRGSSHGMPQAHRGGAVHGARGLNRNSSTNAFPSHTGPEYQSGFNRTPLPFSSGSTQSRGAFNSGVSRHNSISLPMGRSTTMSQHGGHAQSIPRSSPASPLTVGKASSLPMTAFQDSLAKDSLNAKKSSDNAGIIGKTTMQKFPGQQGTPMAWMQEEPQKVIETNKTEPQLPFSLPGLREDLVIRPSESQQARKTIPEKQDEASLHRSMSMPAHLSALGTTDAPLPEVDFDVDSFLRQASNADEGQPRSEATASKTSEPHRKGSVLDVQQKSADFRMKEVEPKTAANPPLLPSGMDKIQPMVGDHQSERPGPYPLPPFPMWGAGPSLSAFDWTPFSQAGSWNANWTQPPPPPLPPPPYALPCYPVSMQQDYLNTGSGELLLAYGKEERDEGMNGVVEKRILPPGKESSAGRIQGLSIRPPTASHLFLVDCCARLWVVPLLVTLKPDLLRMEEKDSPWGYESPISIPSPWGYDGPPSITSVLWWHCRCGDDYGLIGTSTGFVLAIDLCSGKHVHCAAMSEGVSKLHLLFNAAEGIVTLLVTGDKGTQWLLVLENLPSGFCWAEHGKPSPIASVQPTNQDIRSRLAGLKQLSTEKLTLLKQRIAERRTGSGFDSRGGSVHRLSALPLLAPQNIVPGTNCFSKLFTVREGGKPHSISVAEYSLDLRVIPDIVHMMGKPDLPSPSPDCSWQLVTGHGSFLITFEWNSNRLILFLTGGDESGKAVAVDRGILPKGETIMTVLPLLNDRGETPGDYLIITQQAVFVWSFSCASVEDELLNWLVSGSQDIPTTIRDCEKWAPLVPLSSLYQKAFSVMLSQSHKKIARAVRLYSAIDNEAGSFLKLLRENDRVMEAAACVEIALSRSTDCSSNEIKRLLRLKILLLVHLSISGNQTRGFQGKLQEMLETELRLEGMDVVATLIASKMYHTLIHYARYQGILSLSVRALLSCDISGDEEHVQQCLTEDFVAAAVWRDPQEAIRHRMWLQDRVCSFDEIMLRRAATLYDPSQPEAWPWLLSTSEAMQGHLEAMIDFFLSLLLQASVREDCQRVFVPPKKRNIEGVSSPISSHLKRKNIDATEEMSQTGQEIMTVLPDMGIPVLSVACGKMHNLAVTHAGLFAWGVGKYGQLGIGEYKKAKFPVRVHNLEHNHLIDVTAGQFHSMALTESGNLYAWGWGVHGQLGTGDIEDQNVPVLIKKESFPQGTLLKRIYGGYAHSLALGADGRVWMWGSSAHGQAGDGSTHKRLSPTLVPIDGTVTCLATKFFHNVCLIFPSWGGNNVAVIDGDWSSGLLICQWGCSPATLRCMTQSQRRHQRAKGVQNPEQTPENSNPHLSVQSFHISLSAHLATGCKHTLLLTEDGFIYSWGRNAFGQLGLGPGKGTEVSIPTQIVTFPSSIREVAASDDSSYAIDHDGYLWAWGSNQLLQLGTGEGEVKEIRMGRLNLRSPNAFRMTPALVQGISMVAPVSKLHSNEMELPLLHLWASRPDHPLTNSKAACLVILTEALDWLHGFYDPDCTEFGEWMTAAHIAGLKGDNLECLHFALKACDEEIQAKAILNYIFALPDLDKSLVQSCLEQVLNWWEEKGWDWSLLQDVIKSHWSTIVHPLASTLFQLSKDAEKRKQQEAWLKHLQNSFCLDLIQSLSGGCGEMDMLQALKLVLPGEGGSDPRGSRAMLAFSHCTTETQCMVGGGQEDCVKVEVMSGDERKDAVKLVLGFLHDQIKRGNLLSDSQESLQVAIECIENVFGVKSDEVPESFPLSILDLVRQNRRQTEATPAQKQEAEQLKNQGNGLMKSENFLAAADHYTKAIELDGNNAVYYGNRAAAFCKLDRYQDAISDCEKSLQLDPKYSKAYGRMGLAYLHLNNAGKARECFHKALQLEPNNETYLNNLSIAEEEEAKGRGNASSMGSRSGASGAGNQFDLTSILSNPALMNMATQVMSDPNMQQMFSNLLSGGLGGLGGSGNPSGGSGGQDQNESGGGMGGTGGTAGIGGPGTPTDFHSILQ